MAYSNYRSDWNRDRNERSRSRDWDNQSTPRDDDDSRLARESMERDYYGSEDNRRGGYSGRSESDRGPRYNRGYGQGDYDRDANYGGYSSQRGSGQGEGDFQYRGYERSRLGQSQQQNYGQRQSSSGRPSGGEAYGDYSGSASGYHGEGQFRGVGPRGYKRSDERIREEVCDCLTDDDRLDATDIDIAVKDGEVTLTGFVSSRDDKRWAESLAERISGVKEVQNSLRVQEQRRGEMQGSGTQGTSSSSATTSSTTAKDKGKDIQH